MRGYGTAGGRWCRAMVLPLVVMVCVPGCLTSHARYVRPGGGVVTRDGRYLVPRNWDYRADYRIPVSRLRAIVQSYMGTPYRYGGTSRRGVDCSGLVYLVFRELNKARLPRTTKKLKKYGRVVSTPETRPGDLVFFSLGNRGRVDHVGICMGDGTFAHASSSQGVTYSRLDKKYYRTRTVYIRRIF